MISAFLKLSRLPARSGLLFVAGYFGAWFLAGVALEVARRLLT
jgi:predicted metal-binding membrane protein